MFTTIFEVLLPKMLCGYNRLPLASDYIPSHLQKMSFHFSEINEMEKSHMDAMFLQRGLLHVPPFTVVVETLKIPVKFFFFFELELSIYSFTWISLQ